MRRSLADAISDRGSTPLTSTTPKPYILAFDRVWELIILAAFRKWLGGNRAKGLLPKPLAAIGRETPRLKARTASHITYQNSQKQIKICTFEVRCKLWYNIPP